METTSNSPFVILKESIVTWWDSLISLALLSIVWILLCATIVLAPPATFVLFYMASEMLDETMPDTRTLLRGLLTFFLKSWGWFLANLLVASIVYANFVFYRGLGQSWSEIMSYVAIGLGLFWLGIQFFTLPYYMLQQKKSIFLAWRNAAFTALASPGYVLVLWIFFVILIFLSVILVVPVMFGIPALIAIIASTAVRERVRTFKVMAAEKEDRNKQQD